MMLLGMHLPSIHTRRTRAGGWGCSFHTSTHVEQEQEGALGEKAKGLTVEKDCIWYLLNTWTDLESNRAGLSSELGTKGPWVLCWALQQASSGQEKTSSRSEVAAQPWGGHSGAALWAACMCWFRTVLALSLQSKDVPWGCFWPSSPAQGGTSKDSNRAVCCSLALYSRSLTPILGGWILVKKKRVKGYNSLQGFSFEYGLLLVLAVPHQLATCIKGSASPILNRYSGDQKDIQGGCGKLCFSSLSYSCLFSKGLKAVSPQAAVQNTSHLSA